MDTPTLITIIAAIVALIIGYIIATVISKTVQKNKVAEILKKAEADGEIVKEKKMLQAKEKFIQLKSEHDKSVHEKNKGIADTENRLKQKEQSLTSKSEDYKKKEAEIENIKKDVLDQKDIFEKRRQDIEKLHVRHVQQLEALANLNKEDAKAQLVEALKAEAKTNALGYIQEIMEEAKLNANKEAKKIVLQTIQRVGVEASVENAITVFNIESDEIKGRIIGREGRNIRALEAATGVEIIIDDTPEAIVLSCFDPVKREIARLALHQLVMDGRIHPARIEEVVEKVKKQIEEEIMEIGKRTTIDLGIHGLHR